MARQSKDKYKKIAVPVFMAEFCGQGIENIKESDFGWCGEPDEVMNPRIQSQLDEIISKKAFEMRTLQDSILIAIIRGRFPKHEAPGRLLKAKDALFGRENGSVGRQPDIDDFLLTEIARYYRDARFQDTRSKIEVDTIIKKVIEHHPTESARSDWDKNNILARLRAKFKDRKQELLSAVGTETLDERAPMLIKPASFP
jgi:hypothetical protein